MPSMCPPMMYISFGYFVPTFIQITSWRSPGVLGSMLIARIAGSGCESESLFPPRSRMSLTSRRRIVLVRDALDVLASVRLELRLDPVDGVTIALRALPAIAELRQSFDGVLVSLEIEAIDEGLCRVVRRIWHRCACLRRRERRNSRRHEEAAASHCHER